MAARPKSTFGLGRVVATPPALDRAEQNGISPFELLARHARQDWGDIDPGDRGINEQALRNGARILSVYKLADEKELWIITDAATDACPACHVGLGVCEVNKGEWIEGMHFRTDREPMRLSTTILCPEDY